MSTVGPPQLRANASATVGVSFPHVFGLLRQLRASSEKAVADAGNAPSTAAGRWASVESILSEIHDSLSTVLSATSSSGAQGVATASTPTSVAPPPFNGDVTLSGDEQHTSSPQGDKEAPNGRPQQPASMADRPLHDRAYDQAFLDEARVRTAGPKERNPTSHGALNDEWIASILGKIRQPRSGASGDDVEALFLTADEASAVLDSQTPSVPIFSTGKLFRWRAGSRPISQLFRYVADLDWATSVQIPSRECTTPSFEVRTLREVAERFGGDDAGGAEGPPRQRPTVDDPWNVLEMQSPLPSCLPDFLAGENCQLLCRIRDMILSGGKASAGRRSATPRNWNEWKDVIEWVLLSQGGHNTPAHMDSHGFATWLAVQEGEVGFVWLSLPTAEERRAWMDDTRGFTGGRWRYVVLKKGQAVFFPSGVIHAVFRLGDTMMIGGHVLQFTGVVDWLQVMMEELRNPAITNEDMHKAPDYVAVVETLMEARRNAEMVDMAAFEEKLKEFHASLQRPNKKRRVANRPAPKPSPSARASGSRSAKNLDRPTYNLPLTPRMSDEASDSTEKSGDASDEQPAATSSRTSAGSPIPSATQLPEKPTAGVARDGAAAAARSTQGEERIVPGAVPAPVVVAKKSRRRSAPSAQRKRLDESAEESADETQQMRAATVAGGRTCGEEHVCLAPDIVRYCTESRQNFDAFDDALRDGSDELPVGIKARLIQMIVECRVGVALTLDRQYGIHVDSSAQVRDLLERLLDSARMERISSLERRAALIAFAELVALQKESISAAIQRGRSLRRRQGSTSETSGGGARGAGAKHRAYAQLLGLYEGQEVPRRTAVAFNAYLEAGEALTFLVNAFHPRILELLPGHDVEHPALHFEKASLCFPSLNGSIGSKDYERLRGPQLRFFVRWLPVLRPEVCQAAAAVAPLGVDAAHPVAGPAEGIASAAMSALSQNAEAPVVNLVPLAPIRQLRKRAREAR